jgi:hypothetical protein
MMSDFCMSDVEESARRCWCFHQQHVAPAGGPLLFIRPTRAKQTAETTEVFKDFGGLLDQLAKK